MNNKVTGLETSKGPIATPVIHMAPGDGLLMLPGWPISNFRRDTAPTSLGDRMREAFSESCGD